MDPFGAAASEMKDGWRRAETGMTLDDDVDSALMKALFDDDAVDDAITVY